MNYNFISKYKDENSYLDGDLKEEILDINFEGLLEILKKENKIKFRYKAYKVLHSIIEICTGNSFYVIDFDYYYKKPKSLVKINNDESNIPVDFFNMLDEEIIRQIVENEEQYLFPKKFIETSDVYTKILLDMI